MKSSCPSKLALERFFSEGPESRRSADLEAHIGGCGSCRAQLADMAAERRAFLTRYPFEKFRNVLEARKRRSSLARLREWLAPGGALKAAIAFAGVAGIMVFVVWQQNHGPEILTKGGIELSLYISPSGSPEKVERGKDGMSVPSGTAVQFVYSAADQKHLRLVGVEANGSVSNYYNGPTAPGAKVKLPQALLWQPQSDSERFFAVFSLQPIAPEDIEAAARKIAQEGKSIEQTTKLPLPYPQVSILLHRK